VKNILKNFNYCASSCESILTVIFSHQQEYLKIEELCSLCSSCSSCSLKFLQVLGDFGSLRSKSSWCSWH
jgi:hypothetical protein